MQNRLAWFLWIALFWSMPALAAPPSIQEAAAKGDINLVQRWLNYDVRTANSRDAGEGSTPLHYAARNGRYNIAQLLISRGADVNARRKDGESPLADAAANNQYQIAQLLLSHGANVNAHANNGNTPLHWSAWTGKLEATQVLLDSGADVNARRIGLDGWTPLCNAVWNGHVDIVRLLVKHGTDIYSRSNDGNNALHLAAHNGQTDAIQALIAGGADINTPNADGNTPLAVAAWYGQMDLGKLLLALGADIQVKNKAGATAQDEATRAKQQGFVELLSRYAGALEARKAVEETRKASGFEIKKGYAYWNNPKAQIRSVYRSDFTQDAVGAEWSSIPNGPENGPLRVSVTPKESRRFLGDFGNQTIRLSLSNLPAHREISVSVDLFVLRSWDGNDARMGPDVWTLGVMDGPTLLQTTFYNPSDDPDAMALKKQAYPGEYPGDFNPGYTGAAEHNTLGYTCPINGQERQMDAIYKVGYTFAHTAPSLALTFTGSGLEPLSNESWGLDNVRVSIPGETTPVARTVPERHTATLATHTPHSPAHTHTAAHLATRKAPTHRPKPTGKAPAEPRLHARKKAPTP